MNLSSKILYYLSVKFHHSNQGKKNFSYEKVNSEYSLMQYDLSLSRGLGVPISIRNKKILEIGCGHGGKCLFYANNGALEVVGVDIDEDRLGYGKKLKEELKVSNVRFLNMDATNITFDDEYFDLIFAPDVFEHFINPDLVLRECRRLLKTGGKVIVNPVGSIYSKDGAHLKIGIGLPWIYVFFSEKTICNALDELSRKYPILVKYYPGLSNSPTRLVDLRKNKDLNYMTFRRMKNMAKSNGFKICYSHVNPYPWILGMIINKIPIIKDSIFSDVFSKSATYVFEKNKE